LTTAADDIMQVRDLLWNPLQRQLSDHVVLLSLQRSFAKRNKQFQLSDKNFFLKPAELRPAAQDELLTISDYSSPVRVTVRPASADPNDPWLPVSVVNHSDFDLQVSEGAPVVSIYGTPPRIAYSLDVADQVFTLWYQPTTNRPQSMNDTPEIEDDFNTLMVYDATVECGARVREQTKEYKAMWQEQRPLYIANITQWEQIMWKWMRRPQDSGRSYKRTYPFGSGGPKRRSSGGRYYT
jgi:hypothetical protein